MAIKVYKLFSISIIYREAKTHIPTTGYLEYEFCYRRRRRRTLSHLAGYEPVAGVHDVAVDLLLQRHKRLHGRVGEEENLMIYRAFKNPWLNLTIDLVYMVNLKPNIFASNLMVRL